MTARRRRGRPDDFGPVQAPAHLGVERWQFDAGRHLGLIPPGDRANGRRWSAQLLATIDLDALQARVGTEGRLGPAGAAHRLTEGRLGPAGAAHRLTDRLGTAVWVHHIDALAAAGRLTGVGFSYHTGAPLYLTCDLDALTPADLDAVAADAEARQELTTEQAIERLGIRRTELDHLRRARWIEPARTVPVTSPTSFGATALLWRAGDLDALTRHPDLDWAALQALQPGQRSPLRHLPSPEDAQ